MEKLEPAVSLRISTLPKMRNFRVVLPVYWSLLSSPPAEKPDELLESKVVSIASLAKPPKVTAVPVIATWLLNCP
jgi:hypothetical protein